jgi:hypothetical protein
MKWVIFIAALTVLLSCKQGEKTSNLLNKTTLNEKAPETNTVQESLFLTMERTPCFGRCPNYKITIMNTGKVFYNGIKDTEKIGQYTKVLSAKQLAEIQTKMDEINLFEMNNKYDSNITDIPAVALFVIYKGTKNKIFDRYGAPKELKEFEKLIDSIVMDDQMIEITD